MASGACAAARGAAAHLAQPGRAQRSAAEPGREPRGQAGFTLLEVILAVFIFGSVFGLLIELVSENLRKLSAIRDEIVASDLGQQTLREVAVRFDRGEPITSESGRYEQPDYMRYELTVEPYSLELPSEVKKEDAPLSSIYLPAAANGQGTPLRRIVLRVFRENLGPDSAIPLVAVLALPPSPPPDNTNPNDNTGAPAGGQNPPSPGAAASSRPRLPSSRQTR